MLQSASQLEHLQLHAEDGEIGHVADIYLDDSAWAVRYLVASTGHWLAGREVLIAPQAIQSVDWAEKAIHVRLTKAQVESSPEADTEKPVSRQYEAELAAHYDWTPYWSASPLGFVYPTPALPMVPNASGVSEPPGDPHLRSAEEMKGYHVEGTDGSVGHIVDFVLRESDWSIVFLVVDAGSWLHKRNVLLATDSMESVSWANESVKVRLTRAAIEGSPEFTSDFPLTEEYGESLARHYREASESQPPAPR
jgi:uncharacterized protein YrrD